MRTLLKNDITLCREDGSCVKFHIDSHIGSGASCVVYHAVCDDHTEHLLKEYYPRSLDLERDSEGTLMIPEQKKQLFEAGLQRFREGNERQKNVRLSEELKNFTSNVQGYFYGNGTEYIDMTVSAGRTYDKVEKETLYDLLRRMKVLAQAIEAYHEQGLLHLDIKPGNIYVRPENETVEDILLFDFDSVIEESKKKEYSALSYTKTWAAPEQLLPNRRDKICKATDLFAIGEMIFDRIFGRHSMDRERRSFAKIDFDYDAEIFKNVNPKVFPLLRDLLRHTICNVIEKRYQTAGELIAALNEIIPLANPKEHFLISNLPTPKDFFIGRDKEMEEIHEKLQESNILFLHGIGGIGKSELAKQYAKKYRNEYDTVIFCAYNGDFMMSIIDDAIIHINNFAKSAKEDEVDYYKRKIQKLKELLDEKTLLIIDNLDEDEFEGEAYNQWIDVISLNCKMLFTTRLCEWEYSVQEVNVLNKKENLIELFENYSHINGVDNMMAVKEIIDYVNGHTLTIELIARQVQSSFTTPLKLLTLLKEYGISRIGEEKVLLNKDNCQSRKSAFDHITALFDIAELSEREQYILANMSLIPLQGISVDLLSEWCGITGFDEINHLINTGWLKRNNAIINMHPLIAEICNSQCLKNNMNSCDLLMSKIVDFVRSDNLYIDKSIVVILDTIKAEMATEIANTAYRFGIKSNKVAEMFEAIGAKYSSHSSNFALCEKYLCRASDIYREILGDENHNTELNIACALNNIGILYLRKEEYEKAKIFFEKSLDIKIRLFGVKHLINAKTLFNLGSLYKEKEEYKKAIHYYKRVLKLYKKFLGNKHYKTSQQFAYLGLLFETQGKYGFAKKYSKQCLRSTLLRDSENLEGVDGILSVLRRIVTKSIYKKDDFFLACNEAEEIDLLYEEYVVDGKYDLTDYSDDESQFEIPYFLIVDIYDKTRFNEFILQLCLIDIGLYFMFWAIVGHLKYCLRGKK